MNLIQTFKAYLCILKGACKSDKLLNRGRELTNYVCYCHHHTKSHLTLNNSFSGYKRNNYIGCLAKEYRSYLLYLFKRHTLNTYFEEFYLNALPLPTLLFLAIIKFNLLHSGDKLDDITLFTCRLCKSPVIKFTAVFHKEQNPYYI